MCGPSWEVERALPQALLVGQLLAPRPHCPLSRGMPAPWEPLSHVLLHHRYEITKKNKYCPNAVLSQYFELLAGLFDESQRLEVTYLLVMAAGAREADSAIIHATVQLGLFAD